MPPTPTWSGIRPLASAVPHASRRVAELWEGACVPRLSHGAAGELTAAFVRVAGSEPAGKPGSTEAPGVEGGIALTHWALGWLPGPPSLKVIKICPDFARGWAGWQDSVSATVLLKTSIARFLPQAGRACPAPSSSSACPLDLEDSRIEGARGCPVVGHLEGTTGSQWGPQSHLQRSFPGRGLWPQLLGPAGSLQNIWEQAQMRTWCRNR